VGFGLFSRRFFFSLGRGWRRPPSRYFLDSVPLFFPRGTLTRSITSPSPSPDGPDRLMPFCPSESSGILFFPQKFQLGLLFPFILGSGTLGVVGGWGPFPFSFPAGNLFSNWERLGTLVPGFFSYFRRTGLWHSFRYLPPGTPPFLFFFLLG